MSACSTPCRRCFSWPAFVVYPLGQLIYISLTNASLLGGAKFVGLRELREGVQRPTFWTSLLFTLKYTLYITPILMGLGFLLALLTADNTRLKQFTRGVIFLPVVIGLGVSSLLWFWLFDQQVGLFNQVLVDLHILAKPIVWFTDAELALWARDHLGHLEGGRLRHDPVRGEHPVDRP